MRFGKISAILTFAALLCPTPSLSEVAYPASRAAVGVDELYLLDRQDTWSTWCLRAENGEDLCHASMEVSDQDAALVLNFDVEPFLYPAVPQDVDVDPVTYGHVWIGTVSTAPHYQDLSAAIVELDGRPFDAYLCAVVPDKSCARGPWLQRPDLDALLRAQAATVSVLRAAPASGEPEEVARLTVDLNGLKPAFDRAHRFNSEVVGSDPEAGFEVRMCSFDLKGRQKRISYTYDEQDEIEAVTLRESAFGPPGNGDCYSYLMLAYLTPDMTSAQRSMFCLLADDADGSIAGFEQGPRDAYGLCEAPTAKVCEMVNASKEAALAIAGFSSGAVGGAIGTTTVTGTTVVMHSSGAAILTGSSGYVAGTLGTLGTTVLGVLTAPLFVTAAAVSVVAVGGAVYVCREG